MSFLTYRPRLRFGRGPMVLRLLPANDLYSRAALGQMARMKLIRWQFDVVSPTRTIAGAGAHCCVSSATLRFGMGDRRVTEPTAKLSCEMRVVAKAAGVGDRADRLG